MKSLQSKGRLLRATLFVALAVAACKQAGYEVPQPAENGTPQTFQADPAGVAPTARVEAIDAGVSVTWTYVGNKIDIRPSADTVDPNYIGKDQCPNPGIVEATYELGNGAKPVVSRTDCATLATTGQVFNTPGDYLIQMQVKSKDNEVALASMTLRVVAKGITREQVEGGFTIHAKPILAAIDQPILFTGICELTGQITITWDFADGAAKADGPAFNHTYKQNGQYHVTAVCKSSTGKTDNASLTVVVMSNPPAVPEVAIPVPGNNPNLPPATAPACDPAKQSCVPTPNNTPTVTYKPDCTCYENYYYYDYGNGYGNGYGSGYGYGNIE